MPCWACFAHGPLNGVRQAAGGRAGAGRSGYPILRVSAARATAKAIDGARLVILPGVGHDLPAPLWPQIAREVRQLADRAAPTSS